jgi:KDO2-lipid IV(A) lauroyltransferase
MILLRAMARLPLSVLYLFSSLLAFFAFRVFKYRYKVVHENLKKSFPEKNEKEIAELAAQFYPNLTDWIVETLKASAMSEKELLKRVKFVNAEVLEKYLSQNKSVIVMATHQFNWEWMLLAGGARFKVPVDAIYQPVSNKKIENFILEIRSRFGCSPIPKDETLPIVLKRIKEQRIIGLVADQMPAKDNQQRYWTNFLNQDTAFFMGTESLPKLTKMPVVMVGINKVRRGYYEIVLEEIAHPPYDFERMQILPVYVRKVEQQIKLNPESWLWSHRRWKYQRGAYE